MVDKTKIKITYEYSFDTAGLVIERIIEEVKDIDNNWNIVSDVPRNTGSDKDTYDAVLTQQRDTAQLSLDNITAAVQPELDSLDDRLKELRKL